MPQKNKRVAPRREITPLEISSMCNMDNLGKIAKGGEIVEASTTGFLLIVQRDELVPVHLRRNLNIEEIHGMKVMLHLPQMNIEISGTIARTKLLGKRGYAIGIDYTEDAPEYWRECLFDLLPSPGELDEH